MARYPPWLIAISFSQGGALLVFMSFAGALPLIQAEWGLTNVQAGAIQSAGQVGYVLAVLVSASLTDYIDPKRMIVGGVIMTGISNLLFAGFAADTTSAVIFRALVGFGIAGIYMPGMKLISQRIPAADRGGAVGFFVAFFTLGAAVSIALGGILASVLGWRTAFALMTAGPIVGTYISWRHLPAGAARPNASGTPRPIRELLSNRAALAVILIYACHGWEVLGMRSWLAAFLTAVRTEAGLDLSAATRSGSAIAGLATVVAAVATAGIGAVSDRVSRVKLTAAAMILGLIFILLLGWSAHLPWGIVVTVSLVAAFVTNADSAVISTQLTEVVPQDLLGRTLAIYSFLGFTSGSISPLVFGATLDYTGAHPVTGFLDPWTWAFATFAAASVVGLGVVIYLRKTGTKLQDQNGF